MFLNLLTVIAESAGPSTWIVPKNEHVAGSSPPEDLPETRESVEATPNPSKHVEFSSTTVSNHSPTKTSTQESLSSIKREKRALDDVADEGGSAKRIKTSEEIELENKAKGRVRRVSNLLAFTRT